MRLLFKFNLIFVVVFAVGLAATGLIARDMLQRNAQDEILDRARLLMEKAVAVRSYTSSQIAPLLETQLKYAFAPQSVPAYSAIEVLATLQQKHPDYAYKEATLNPTNPRDRASGWEVDIVNQFRNSAELKEFVGERETPSGRSLYVSRPIRITDGACLRCHSTVDAAPKTLLDRYGPANGFGWRLGEVVGAQIVSVPMSVPLNRADDAFKLFMGLLVAVFVLIGVSLNLMLWQLVVRPVSRLSALADKVSLGELDAPEFTSRSKDEIGVLVESFARMRRSVVQAMKMLGD